MMVKKVEAKPMQFKFYAPKAKKVSLAGDFNKWDAKGNSAKKDTKGTWSAKVALKPGKYEYKFIVDGTWLNDPSNNILITNSFGTQNSVVEVK
jgi:1,4-alpha-glucan branching enzyme